MASDAFLTATQPDLHVARGYSIPRDAVTAAVIHCNQTAGKLGELPVDLFGLLGMRNLSALVGELFAATLHDDLGHTFEKNPHQDGYPDLLLMDAAGQRQWNSLRTRLRDKAPFSPFTTGGVEIKATCGSVPTDKECRKRGYAGKLQIGEQRIDLLTGYDWKAHHRATNNLLGLLWDFVGKAPQIVAAFYCNRLTQNDWGKIVQPKAGGGRTTSVSIMTRAGIGKMYAGWVRVRGETRFWDASPCVPLAEACPCHSWTSPGMAASRT